VVERWISAGSREKALAYQPFCHDELVFASTFPMERVPKLFVFLQRVDNMEKMTRALDDWRSAGLDNAIMVESVSEPDDASERWLEKAIYCFEQVGDTTH